MEKGDESYVNGEYNQNTLKQYQSQLIVEYQLTCALFIGINNKHMQSLFVSFESRNYLLLFRFSCRQLGLDLVPRKEYAMVDPEEISITELYRLVCECNIWYFCYQITY